LQRKTRQYRVKSTTFPSSGERFVLIEGPPSGITLEAPALYAVMSLRERGCSPNTMYLAMQAVAIMLEWAASRSPAIDIDERLGTGMIFSREEIHALRRELRRDLGASADRNGGRVVSTAHYYNRCHAVRNYVVWHAENIMRRIPVRETLRVQEHRIRLEDFSTMMVSDLPSPRAGSREGVDENVEKAFLEAIRPGSATNPFQKQHQSRNHALLLLYHIHGLRRAEALKIKGEDLFLTGPQPMVRILVRVDEPSDPRRIEPRAKTEGRDVPLGAGLVEALKDWVLVHRSSYPGAKKTPYIFVARDGAPLSLNAVNDMFRLLRSRVPGISADFTTHHLRHTANDRLTDVAEELGWDEAEEKRNRNYQFGWAKNSDQGEKYRTRSTRRRAAEASLRLQEKSWASKC